MEFADYFNKLMATIETRFNVVLYVFRMLRPPKIYVFTVSFFAFVAGIFAAIIGNQLIGLIIALAALLIDIALLTREFLEIASPTSSRFQIDGPLKVLFDAIPERATTLAEIENSPEDKRDGFVVSKLFTGDVVSYSEIVDTWLSSQPVIKFTIDEKWERKVLDNFKAVLPELQDFLMVKSHKSKRLFNQSKTALMSNIPLQRRDETILVGRTSYFTSLLTNEACMYRLLNEGQEVADLRRLYPCDIIGGKPILRSISISRMSNHIGVSLLAISSDGYPIIWEQDQRSEINRHKLVPSATGSLDWNDIRDSGASHFLEIIKNGMARELWEEASFKDVPSEDRESVDELRSKIQVLGYFRWLQRGGKPEFIGIVKLKAKFSSIGSKNWEVHVPNIPVDQLGTFSSITTYFERLSKDSNLKIGIPLGALMTRLQTASTEKSDELREIKRVVQVCWQLDE